LVLIGILCLILFCLHRRKKTLKTKENAAAPDLPPAELGTTVPQEMAATDVSKYVSMHDQTNSIALAHYPGHVQQHSHSASHDLHSSYPAQVPPSYGHAPPYTSPVEGGHASQSSHGGQFFTEGNVTHNSPPAAWSTQANYPQSTQGQDSQYSYPTPTSPRQSPHDFIQQQVPIYYPRPSDPSTRSRESPPSHSGNRGSPAGTQYSSDGHAHNISTTHTPAHFYAQPSPHGSPGSDNRRPIQGRFVEEGHM
jgi:hypothetical protein